MRERNHMLSKQAIHSASQIKNETPKKIEKRKKIMIFFFKSKGNSLSVIAGKSALCAKTLYGLGSYSQCASKKASLVSRFSFPVKIRKRQKKLKNTIWEAYAKSEGNVA